MKYMKQKIILAALLFSIINLQAQITNGIRISFLTDSFTTAAQVNFINSHFDYVMTPVLSDTMRNKYSSVGLLLYRSIRGAWDDQLQFDWNFLDAHENMFCHSDSTIQDTCTRIETIYGSYLMDGGDIVSSTAPDAITHWINYYAITASHQVDSCDYDGLFMDSAGHKLNSDELEDTTKIPWDYSDSTWRDDRYVALNFVKSYLPNKLVIFNGLHSDNGADSSLYLTDGGMWEDFAYNCNTGDYKGVGGWWQAITCMQNNRDIARLILTVKKPGLINDTTARTFSVASYLLIVNDNTVLTLSDYSWSNHIQYFPEFNISLGTPTGDFYYNQDSLFIREFDDGMVLVNPFATSTKTYTLNQPYYKVTGTGGGIIDSNATYNGCLNYDSISGTVTIPPVSALILKNTMPSIIRHPDKDISFKTYPNPFNDNVKIEFSLPESMPVTVEIYDETGKRISTIVNHERLSGGKHVYEWNTLSSGIYYCIITVSGTKITEKIIRN